MSRKTVLIGLAVLAAAATAHATTYMDALDDPVAHKLRDFEDPRAPRPQSEAPYVADVDAGLSDPTRSFAFSLFMIIASEIGDKTFLIAALLAMKHPRLTVFAGAFASLLVMSVLSAVLGHAVPTLIPKKYTAILAAGLFLVFGVKMLFEGLAMEKGNAGVMEEMKEVEEELEAQSEAGHEMEMLEEGRANGKGKFARTTRSPTESEDEESSAGPLRRSSSVKNALSVQGAIDGVQNLAGLVFSPIFVQAFIMTFLGEWGDRSQIATIAMAAGQDYWWVILGTITGHGMCTTVAVIGGRMLASKISVRNVTLGGAILFVLFGFIYLYEAWAQ
ncbi:GCR1-dependent translation factor 1 [Saitoella coloradoensis]